MIMAVEKMARDTISVNYIIIRLKSSFMTKHRKSEIAVREKSSVLHFFYETSREMSSL